MYITNYVKTLLIYVHGEYLRLNPPVLVDATLIHRIIRLPMVGEDPAPLFADNTTDKVVVAQSTTYYNLSRGKCALLVEGIKDKAVKFETQLLAGKLLRHQRPNQVSTSYIRAAENCAMGVTMSWAYFLVEEFQMDCLDAQEKRSPFHYSWLLILIALMGWGEPTHSAFLP